jgi:GNAT superfamily N-acetyltransferase
VCVVRRLEAGDDLASFRSTNRTLNRWVQKFGLANQNLFGVTYVAVEDNKVLGFLTVASSVVEAARVGKDDGTTPKRWPCLLIARLAVAKDSQGKGIGKKLMRKAFELAAQQRENTGCNLVTVDSKPESVGFYKKFMFEPMTVVEGGTPDYVPMFLPMETVLAAMKG